MSLDALEARVSAIEERLGQEAGPRASQDRDLATIGQRVNATNHLVQALSITQAEHTATLAEHAGFLASAHDKLDRIVVLLRRLSEGERP